jgi:uncharacterized protein YprB with RNaseH-like and TPR domain
MLDHIKIENILFLDIETVPIVYEYGGLDPLMRGLWDSRFRFHTDGPEQMYKKAGIFAEFAKVICISVGYFNGREFRIKSFYGDDEKQILGDFSALISKHFNRKEHLLCAHNGKEFDFPFLCRRMIINGLKLPKPLNIAGKKPWEVNHLDTMELWKFGDYKSYTSLSLLAAVFGIDTPKGDIDGSQVASVYYEDKNLERIVKYCCGDVLTVAQILLRFMSQPLITQDNIIYT